ncbi:MAG: hypothetical protein V1487_04695, partial [bacterium]
MATNKLSKPVHLLKSDLQAISKDVVALLGRNLPQYHPYLARARAVECVKSGTDPYESDPSSVFSTSTQAMIMQEFDLGLLMISGLPETMSTFALNLSLNLQKQYDCKTPAEQSLAEIVALNYCRVLYTQQCLNRQLHNAYPTKVSNSYLYILSKEMDRAQRQYLATLQTLVAMKMPPITYHVKANTANLAYQQVVQV